MIPLLESYLDRLQALHADIQRTIDGLPQDALDWSPGADMNSLAVLAVHVAGAERYWIGDVAGQEPSGRDRAAEFRTKQVDVSELTARLDAVLTHSRGVLERLTLADLETKRTAPRHGEEYTIAWSLAHALEHTAIHVGHMQIVRQLWDHDHPNP